MWLMCSCFMIKINASNKLIEILKNYNISLDALQYTLSFILQIYTQKRIIKVTNKEFELKIICRKSDSNYALYDFDSKKIIICSACIDNKNNFISSLLHEFRHWIQHTIDNISPLAILSKGIKYENNAYEQQCVQFENDLTDPTLITIEQYNKIYNHFNK